MKKHIHHIRYKSQGGSDDPSNLETLDFIEHARLHAIDFINGGPQFDFRHEGWPYLDRDLREKVRKTHSRRMSKRMKGLLVGYKNPMFGIRQTGDKNPMFGKKHTDETKRKISKLKKGVYAGDKNPMFGSNRTGDKNPMFGKKHTDETKRKISEKLMGRPSPLKGKSKTLSPEGLKSLRENGKKRVGEKNGMFGKTHTEEVKAKLSALAKEREFSKETRAKMSANSQGEGNPFFGKKHSEEARQKMKAAWELRKQKKNEQNGSV
jgi:hypothetical protein